MQTIQLKYDIISWVTELDDEKLIRKLHKWIDEQEPENIVVEKIAATEKIGSLTEGYGIWADDAPFNETNYRDQLWQPEKNVW
ncbi:MAG: hypothetical protein LBE82_04375 [Chitinophagaceae bacterium]|jgi:hypothetical protein|nr:hypothetical protein [Chitinophagaceae bacterium]